MSHTVTVTRTTTTTSTSAIILNTGYLKTLPGFLKLLQVICGAIALFLIVYYNDRYKYQTGLQEIFFISIATTFFIGSLCLLISCLISISTAPFIAKTSYGYLWGRGLRDCYTNTVLNGNNPPVRGMQFTILPNAINWAFSRTETEVVYHFVAFLLYLIASIILLIDVNNYGYKYRYHQPIYIAAVLGVVLTALYLVSTILAYRAYRGT